MRPVRVLEYESTLDVKRHRGVHASFHKRERVRYLQNSIIAASRPGLGRRRVSFDYRCTPAYRSTATAWSEDLHPYSLREVKNRGDITSSISSGGCTGFRELDWILETEISHRTRHAQDPSDFSTRPDRPSACRLSRAHVRGRIPWSRCASATARWPLLVSLETSRPRLYERYLSSGNGRSHKVSGQSRRR